MDHFLWKKNKERKKSNNEIDVKNNCQNKDVESSSLQNEPSGTVIEQISLDPASGEQCTQLDIRSRLQNLAFIFSLPHLVMLSNLQKLIGIRTGRKPSIQVKYFFYLKNI